MLWALRELTMILGENENPNIWRDNIYSALKDLSDIEYQKLTWLGKHPKYISSFTETLARVYDDFDFERYIQYYESINGKNKIYIAFSELDKMIDDYQKIGYETEKQTEGSQLILKDPNWIKITEKAKEIIELIKTH